MPSADVVKKEPTPAEETRPPWNEIVDQNTFDQILQMDDDDEREFSRSIVFGFIDQAVETFSQMDDSIKGKDLEKLSSLGHFLKGSSATLGLIKLRDYCEKIQNYGNKKDEKGVADAPDEEECLKNIRRALEDMKKEYKNAEAHLVGYYRDASACINQVETSRV